MTACRPISSPGIVPNNRAGCSGATLIQAVRGGGFIQELPVMCRDLHIRGQLLLLSRLFSMSDWLQNCRKDERGFLTQKVGDKVCFAAVQVCTEHGGPFWGVVKRLGVIHGGTPES